MICLILAFIQTVCAIESSTIFAEIVESYLTDQSSNVSTNTLLKLIAEIAVTNDIVVDEIALFLGILTVSVIISFVITWIILCSYITKQKTMLELIRHPSDHMKSS